MLTTLLCTLAILGMRCLILLPLLVGHAEGKAHPICSDVLWRLGVSARHADIACDLATA
ncbi:hypothetical protein GCM10010303_64210 [Streptomyces purpurascens]|nr:hypothetical protein GCM10010303_64210 [Streptomyces purpurascens]